MKKRYTKVGFYSNLFASATVYIPMFLLTLYVHMSVSTNDEFGGPKIYTTMGTRVEELEILIRAYTVKNYMQMKN